ncbi:hypothetical protein DER46DRAFT_601230 [Fusarium sp. MPI-SDFR-AT-0072]|nr:hypothetical protein DER46DRAFT_601230 [Fusarium sp. MPI-SDFR-AT-0072]
MPIASRTCLLSLSLLIQLLRIIISVDQERQSLELRATHRGEQTTIIDARANLELKDAAKTHGGNTKAVAAEWVGTNEAQLPFLSVKLHETQEAISGRVALALFALVDVLFPLTQTRIWPGLCGFKTIRAVLRGWWLSFRLLICSRRDLELRLFLLPRAVADVNDDIPSTAL